MFFQDPLHHLYQQVIFLRGPSLRHQLEYSTVSTGKRPGIRTVFDVLGSLAFDDLDWEMDSDDFAFRFLLSLPLAGMLGVRFLIPVGAVSGSGSLLIDQSDSSVDSRLTMIQYLWRVRMSDNRCSLELD